MDRAELLKSIAEMGYNVGFGAKKSFATYDIIMNTPGLAGAISLIVGILGLVFDALSSKVPSAVLAVLGVTGILVSTRDAKKHDYEAAGKELTKLYNELRDLHRGVKAGSDIGVAQQRLKTIETAYYAASISQQILFSDWYAHYKFFVQGQYDWVDEQKHFTIRDKVPLSFVIAAVLVTVGCVWAVYHFRAKIFA